MFVVLATPSLASIFDNGSKFLRTLLQNSYRDIKGKVTVQILGAIVDQVSLPSQMSGVHEVSSRCFNTNGMEGLSIYVAHRSLATAGTKYIDADPEVDSSSGNPTAKTEGTGAEGQRSLTFILSPSESFKGSHSPNFYAPLHEYRIRVPLTNTVFVNGRESTLSRQVWSVYQQPDDSVQAECQSETLVSQAEVHIPLFYLQAALKPEFKDFYRLTPPRVVAKAAGNIIRSFSKSTANSPGNNLEEIGASEELEAALSRPFESGRNPPDVYEVWAQVTVRERWSQMPRGNTRITDSIEAGDRFFKVLGGGGGWGNQRGLIALDSDAPFGGDSRVPVSEDEPKPFSDIIRPGDVVRFIRVQTPRGHEQRIKREKKVNEVDGAKLRLKYVGGGQSLRFGRTSSHRVSGNASGYPDYRYEYKALIARGHFGALSEQGGSVSLDTIVVGDRDKVGVEVLGSVVETKLPPCVDLSYCALPMQDSAPIQRMSVRSTEVFSPRKSTEAPQTLGARLRSPTLAGENLIEKYVKERNEHVKGGIDMMKKVEERQ